jgi:hypothetical protein
VTDSETLRSQREWLESGLAETYREVDKLIVGVSSAVLAFSVALVDRGHEQDDDWSIKASWVLLLLSIALVLFSLVMEQRERSMRMDKIDAAIMAGDLTHQDVSGPWAKAVATLNYLGLAAFFVGLVLLAVFLMTSLG